MRALDGFGRLVILVMSALATLSLIASLASVSNAPLPMPGIVGEPGVAERGATTAPNGPAAATGAGESRGARVPAGPPAPPDPMREAVRWLEALTYAVLALAGFAAVGVVLLLRIGSHLARIAER